MLLKDIHPFVRFARYLDLSDKNSYPVYIPYDCRLFYVASGKANMRVFGHDYILSAGDAVIINSGVEYRTAAHNKETASVIAINFDYTFDESNAALPIAPMRKTLGTPPQIMKKVIFEDSKDFSLFVVLRDVRELEETLRRIVIEYNTKIFMNETECSALMMLILRRCVNRFYEDSRSLENPKMREIIRFIQTHYAEPLTNIELGKIFGYHPNYISSLIKKCTGKTLHQYILGIRIARSIALLETGSYTVKEVSSMVGFYDCSYFSRYFKKSTGKAAKEFILK